jgi:DinB family protein
MNETEKAELRPEQQRALVYARRRGSEAAAADVRSRVRGTYAALEQLVGGVPAGVAREHRPTSAWSIQEVVDHLVESDRPAVGQLSDLLAGRDVEEPIAASLQSRDPLGHDWDALRAALAGVHRDVLAVLEGASDATPLAARAAVQMVVKCARPGATDGTLEPVSWRERFDWKAYAILVHAHNREHIAQIERILAAGAPAAAR